MDKICILGSEEELDSCKEFYIYFTAKWCNKCKKSYDELCDFISNYDEKWFQVDIDNFSDISIEYEVQKLPEYLYVSNNKVLFRCNTINELKNFQKKI